MSLLYFISRAVELYSFLLIAYALLSWFPGAYDTKLGELIIKLTRPYLSLFDRFNLSVGPIDFTIIVAIFALNIVSQTLLQVLARMIY